MSEVAATVFKDLKAFQLRYNELKSKGLIPDSYESEVHKNNKGMEYSNDGYIYNERILIRAFYLLHPIPNRFLVSSYNFKMSSLEKMTWHELAGIREGLNYGPEYPVGKYFVDFGDPVKKIAIECDSNEFHRHTVKKDIERQMEIEQLGWKVFRFGPQQILSNIYEGEVLGKDHGENYTGIDEQIFVDANADNCVGCFLNSTFFKRLYNPSFDRTSLSYDTEDEFS